MKLFEFTKKKDFLICIDSDGTAMDTMGIKHMRCFAPCMIAEWGLEQWTDSILQRWGKVNLYKMTRGMNRFQALLDALTEADLQYLQVKGLGEFEYWVETSPELSNESLQAEFDRTGKEIFQKALRWSEESDKKIAELEASDKKAFSEVKESLAYASQFADIAIISANDYETVSEEWKTNGLLEYADVICSREDGTTVGCIKELLSKRYPVSHVMMTGDTPIDMKSAQKNGVFFFPILTGHENESWKEFRTSAVENLTHKKFAGPCQRELLDKFTRNLSR